MTPFLKVARFVLRPSQEKNHHPLFLAHYLVAAPAPRFLRRLLVLRASQEGQLSFLFGTPAGYDTLICQRWAKAD